jgi:hypothetical protein
MIIVCILTTFLSIPQTLLPLVHTICICFACIRVPMVVCVVELSKKKKKQIVISHELFILMFFHTPTPFLLMYYYDDELCVKLLYMVLLGALGYNDNDL